VSTPTSGYALVPRRKFITAITNAQYAVLTFSEDHNYTDGEIVSFRVTPPFGMVEINNLQSEVLSHTNNTITVNIDSSFWTPFIYPVAGKVSPPTCVPSASGILPNVYPPTISLEDCFDNIRT
jgi:hypothetical protein